MAPSEVPRSRLLCVPESILSSEPSPSSSTATACRTSPQLGQVLAFTHPRGGYPSQYLLSPAAQLCELQSFRPSGSKFGSWFVEQRVVSDGLLYVATPVDPKLLLLPVLEKYGATRFSPLEQLLAAEADESYLALRQCQGLDLHLVCDVNDQLGEDMLLYRLNAEKTMDWLAKKVARATQALVALEAAREEENNGMGSGFAAGFVVEAGATQGGSTGEDKRSTGIGGKVQTREATREEARLAVELVSEYLSEAWAVKLQHRCGFSEEEMRQGAGAKKRSAWDGDGDFEQGTAMALTQGKRGKGGGEGGREGPGGPGGEPGGAGGMRSAQGGQSLAQKKLAKTNLKGVKSISSFFGKKAKA